MAAMLTRLRCLVATPRHVAASAAIVLLALLVHFDRRIARHTRRLAHEAMARRAFAASLPRPEGKATIATAGATTAASRAAAQEALSAETPWEVRSREVRSPHALSCLSPREQSFVSLLYPVTAAVVAGWTPLLVKQSLLLLGAAIAGDNSVWSHNATFCILGAVLCSAPLQLTCLAKGLRYVEAQQRGHSDPPWQRPSSAPVTGCH